MNIFKFSASRASVPTRGERNWNPPSDAKLMRHVYMIDENSPRRKDYIIRIVCFPIDNANSHCIVTVAYWGGSVDSYGSRTTARENQVKNVDMLSNASPDRVNLWSVQQLKDTQISKGYRELTDVRMPFSSGINPNQIDLLFRGQSSEINNLSENIQAAMGLRGGNRQNMNSPTAPSRPNAPQSGQPSQNAPRSQTSQPANTPPRPTPEQQVADKLRVLKEKTIQNLRKRIESIKLKDPVAESVFKTLCDHLSNSANDSSPETQVLLSPDVKPVLQELFNEAVLGGFLFFKVLACPPELLEKVGLSAEAKQRIQDYLDIEATPVRTRKFSSRDL